MKCSTVAAFRWICWKRVQINGSRNSEGNECGDQERFRCAYVSACGSLIKGDNQDTCGAPLSGSAGMRLEHYCGLEPELWSPSCSRFPCSERRQIGRAHV